MALESDVWHRAECTREVWVGIDLGTSNSAIALWHWDKSVVKVVKTGETRSRSMPSVASWAPGADLAGPPSSVGAAAAAAATLIGGCAVRAVKRVIGLRWATAAALVRSLPFTLVEGPDGEAAIELHRDGAGSVAVTTPQAVSAAVLAELKAAAEQYLGTFKTARAKAARCPKMAAAPSRVTHAVIGVPVQFDESQRQATRRAALSAGFTHVALMAESTAAAVNYGLFVAGSKVVLVFDAGGGTTDVTLMRIEEGCFSTLGNAGDNHLGGEDMDTALLNMLLARADVSEEAFAAWPVADRARLRAACAEAKEQLSSRKRSVVPCGRAGEGETRAVEVTQDDFAKAIAPLVARARALVLRVLDTARENGKAVDQVDEVVLVGGASRTPALREMLSDLLNRQDLCVSQDAATSVACGLAIRGAIMSGVDSEVVRDLMMIDVLPQSIGVEDHSEHFPADQHSPASGRFDVLLAKHTRLPATTVRTFRLADAAQNGATVHLFEGEHEIARRNTHVASFDFLLPDAPPEDKQSTKGREVELRVTMTEAGELSAVLVDAASVQRARSSAVPVSGQEMALGGLLLVLGVLFVVLKLCFAKELGLSGVGDEQEGDGSEL